jgi:hypothetical protein
LSTKPKKYPKMSELIRYLQTVVLVDKFKNLISSLSPSEHSRQLKENLVIGNAKDEIPRLPSGSQGISTGLYSA